MKNTRAFWVFVPGILLLALGVVLFLVLFERVDQTVREFPSEEARRNTYLALERLARAADFDSRTHAYLDYPDTYGVVFLADSSTRPTPEKVLDWAYWVEEQGGHLILSVPDNERNEVTAPLLARLGFRYPGADLASDANAPIWPQDIPIIRYQINGGDAAGQEKDAPVKDAPAPSTTLAGWVAEDADWLAINHTGEVIAATRNAGWGRVTLLRSAYYFHNENIEKGQHATLALDLARLDRKGAHTEVAIEEGPVLSTVLYGERQSWMAYVFRFTWPALVTLFLILLFALGRGRRRFGPMLADPAQRRRSRLEHIEAVGRFLWERDASIDLILATQRGLLRELERRNPQLRSATPATRWAIIAQLLGIEVDEARYLFKIPSAERHSERFIAQIRTLESYRRQL